MNASEVVNAIFGKEFLVSAEKDLTGIPSSASDVKQPSPFEFLPKQVEEFLNCSAKARATTDSREGRLGPPAVKFDVATHVGSFIVGSDRLSLNSQSNFSSIRANVCIYKGKWQYELQLGSKGVMQVGWATAGCRFSQEIGVGDTTTSYAYDGNRVRKWNYTTHKYGESWLSGDIIGCTIDLDKGVIEFYRNGRSMGVAFDDVHCGPGIAYFPAVSLAFTENLVANFGATPLRYPVEGYLPIQDKPHSDVSKANTLLKWLSKVLKLLELKTEEGQGAISIGTGTPGRRERLSHQANIMVVASVIMHHLGPLLLSSYVTEACFVPFLEHVCGEPSTRSSLKKTRLNNLLDIFWAFLEEHELKQCLESVIICLLTGFRHASFVLEYPHQRLSLRLLIDILRHMRTRQYLLQHVLFDKIRFPNFVHIKPLDEGGLAAVVSTPWWPTSEMTPAREGKKQAYLESCQRIKEAITGIESLQVELLKILLDNSDGTPTQPSSRKIFLKKFREFLRENIVTSRSVPFLQTPLPVTLCCFHRLLVTFRALWEKEVASYPVVIPARIFYDGSVNYFTIDRLGGVLSHLQKALREDLGKVLGTQNIVSIPEGSTSRTADTSAQTNPEPRLPAPEESNTTITESNNSVTTEMFSSSSMSAAGFLDAQSQAAIVIPIIENINYAENMSSDGTLLLHQPLGMTSEVKEHGALDPALSLIELLDGIILFFHIAAYKQLGKVSTLRDSMNEYVTAMEETRKKLEFYYSESESEIKVQECDSEVIDELRKASEVFDRKLSEQSRHMAWVVAAVYSTEKQTQIAWLLRVILQSVKIASQQGPLFSFLPDFYLDALIETCAALRNYFHPTAPLENIEGYQDLLIEVAEFLCIHFADQRIVHANSKDTLIQALATFVCNQNTLTALERVPYASQMNMVRNLLRPYENRAWAQSNWVLVRLWQGCGFAFRYQKSPHLNKKLGPKILHPESSLINQAIKPCPSPLLQEHVAQVLVSDEALATAFINSVLNQLNWAFSEFIGMLQEIQNVSNRPERVFIESKQLKICATCFDLALSLLRVVEMVVSIAPAVFTDSSRPSADLLLARLCQLLCQVLNRVSSQVGCFQHVVLLEIPDLETVDHFPILAAVIGILLALLRNEIGLCHVSSQETPKVTSAILSEPSFQLGSLHFVLGDMLREDQEEQKSQHSFSFRMYADDVSTEEIEDVKTMIHHLDVFQHKFKAARKSICEEELCPICYAYPISATFKPCNHRSCRCCIAHHLMNSRECFFCKAIIQTVVDEDGVIIHDLTKEK